MPSAEHNDLAKRALKWVNNRASAKGIRSGPEVIIDENYVVDAAALCRFAHRFEKYYDIPYLGLPSQYTSEEAYYQDRDKICDHLSVFEVKVSRNDFLKTFKHGNNGHINRHSPVGSFHWCVTPRGLIDPDELPDFWGLLVAYGNGLREIKKPTFNQIQLDLVNSIAYTLLWKRKPYGWE